MYQAVLADAKFHEQLLQFDRDIAAGARAAGCTTCGGVLHSARFQRKPRGGPGGLSEAFGQRFSFCCAVDGCRKRTTPASLRFLGRKVYLATVVTLISAMREPEQAKRWVFGRFLITQFDGSARGTLAKRAQRVLFGCIPW